MAEWHVATLESASMVAVDIKSLRFTVEGSIPHKSGQHYDIRLTSEDGYQAERSYSIASSPEEEGVVEFGVQLLKNGEVSPYLFALQPGEQVEIRGPIGGHFIWDVSMPGPLILVGGGSGMVPLVSMLRHHEKHDDPRDIVFLVSARSEDYVLYREELAALLKKDAHLKVAITLTDLVPLGWMGYRRRVDTAMLTELFSEFKGKMPMIYVCGPTPFVEKVATGLLDLGFNSHEIRTERFGG